MGNGFPKIRFSQPFIAAFCVCFLGISIAGNPTNGVAADIPVVYESGKLSADVTEIPLDKILTALSEEAEIAVYIDPSLRSKRITARFESLPLDEGIKRLISPYSSAFVYRQEAGDGDGQASFHVAEVQVFDRGKEDSPLVLVGKLPSVSDTGVTGKRDLHQDTTTRTGNVSVPAYIKDPARAATLHKRSTAQSLRSRIQHTMARIRRLEQKQQDESAQRQRKIQELKEALENAPESESRQLQAKLAIHQSEARNMRDRDHNELMKFRKELNQLRKRQAAIHAAMSSPAGVNTSQN